MKVLDEPESKTRLAEYTRDVNCHNYYMFRVSKHHIIDAGPCGNVARFINHSCDPNCVSQKWLVNGVLRVGIFSNTRLEKGTELSYDYNFETDWLGGEGEAQSDSPCRCGAESCSGIFGSRPIKKSAKKDSKKKKSKSNKKRTRKGGKTGGKQLKLSGGKLVGNNDDDEATEDETEGRKKVAKTDSVISPSSTVVKDEESETLSAAAKKNEEARKSREARMELRKARAGGLASTEPEEKVQERAEDVDVDMETEAPQGEGAGADLVDKQDLSSAGQAPAQSEAQDPETEDVVMKIESDVFQQDVLAPNQPILSTTSASEAPVAVL